jgi:beta-galactosidase
MSFAFECDFFRSIKPGRPYFVMETSPSYNGWLRDTGSPHPTGFLAVEGAMAYGLGGHSFNYWLWREQRAGVEQPHGAVIYSWGAPEISFIEVQKVTALFQKLRPVLDATKPAPSQAAVTWSDRARVFMGTEPIGGNVDYHNIVSDWHHRLVAAGIPRDIRLEGASLDGLKLLVTPAMPYVSPEFLARVKPWVEAGGIWIAGPLTGMRTADHTVPTDANLGLLEKFAGIESVFSYPVKKSGAQGTALGLTVPLTGWCSAVRAASPDTTVLGTIATALPSNGLGFLTERKMGKGKVVLLTTQPDGKDGSPLLDKIVDHYASEAGLARVPAGDDLLVCPRVTPDGRSLWIILNMGGKPNSATLPAGAADALTGDTLPAGPLALDPYGCRVVKF